MRTKEAYVVSKKAAFITPAPTMPGARYSRYVSLAPCQASAPISPPRPSPKAAT